ncbi:MAG: hypothetical protein ABI743_06895, partial [bacterium]
RYRAYQASAEVVASPDQVLLFAHQWAAARVAAGGEAWITGLSAAYLRAATKLMSEYPQFAALDSAAGRSAQLASYYASPRVKALVDPLTTIRQLLIASGPAGYQALLDMHAETPPVFVPFPEELALAGGGQGLALLTDILNTPGVDPATRRSLIALALDHATSTANAINLAQGLLQGATVLYGYDETQRTQLADLGRGLLLDGGGLGEGVDATALVIFPNDAAPAVPNELQAPARLIMRFPDPPAEIARLLSTGDVQTQLVALAALAMTVDQAADFTPEEWAGTEPGYIGMVTPFLADTADSRARDLALLVVLQLAASPLPIGDDSVAGLSPGSPSLAWLLARPEPQYGIARRLLALRWFRRGMSVEALALWVPDVRDYAVTLDLQTVGLDAAVDLVALDTDLRAATQPPLVEDARLLDLCLAALDRMNLFQRFESLPLVLAAINARTLMRTLPDPLVAQLQAAQASVAAHPETLDDVSRTLLDGMVQAGT